MNQDPEGAASREARRKRRLLDENTCVVCGEDRNQVLERHHLAGRENAPELLVTLCRNCHGVETAALLDLGVPMSPPDTHVARVIAIVGGIGRLLITLGTALIAEAAFLVTLRVGLDADYPGWRERPWGSP